MPSICSTLCTPVYTPREFKNQNLFEFLLRRMKIFVLAINVKKYYKRTRLGGGKMRKRVAIFFALLLFFVASHGPTPADPVKFDDDLGANLSAPFDNFTWTTPPPTINKPYSLSFEDSYGSPSDEIGVTNRIVLMNERHLYSGHSDFRGADSFSTLSRDTSVSESIMEPSHGKSESIVIQPKKTAKAASKASMQSSSGAQSVKGVYTIQVGAFGKKENAEYFRKQLQNKHPNVIMGVWESNADHLYHVHLGSFSTEAETRRYKEILKSDNLPGVVVRRD
jgi:septal ring-binding cell division protein DamX